MDCLLKKINMKVPVKSLALILGLMMIVSCVSTKPISDNINRKWMLVEFQDFSKNQLVKNNAYLDLSIKDQFNAKMGCNGMMLKANFKSDGKVEFSPLASTMMYCADNMKLEDAFGKALPTMNHYKIEGHFLTLSSKDGNKMKFVAADWD